MAWTDAVKVLVDNGVTVFMILAMCYYIYKMTERHTEEIKELNERHNAEVKELTKALYELKETILTTFNQKGEF